MPSSAVPPRVRPAAALVLLAVTACAHGQPHRARAGAAERDSVPVGYGTQAKREVTGSVSSIAADSLQRGTVRTMADLLEGRVAGLEVQRLANGGVSVRIRGQRSLRADGEPLYVVDGIPMDAASGVLIDLDPRDVKSVEVLKDAGSLAAYGSRGANGVIMIRTKRPPKK